MNYPPEDREDRIVGGGFTSRQFAILSAVKEEFDQNRFALGRSQGHRRIEGVAIFRPHRQRHYYRRKCDEISHCHKHGAGGGPNRNI